MAIRLQAVIRQNITLVYDALDLHTIDRNKLKNFSNRQHTPTVMDAPDLLVAVLPPDPLVMEIGDRRIRITLPRPSEKILPDVLGECATEANRLVTGSKSKLRAFGLNIDLDVVLSDRNARELLLKLFISDRHLMEDRLGGTFISFVPRMRVQRGDTLWDLVLDPEPQNEQHVKVHLNAHVECHEQDLPPQSELAMFVQKEFDSLVDILPRLLTEEGSGAN